MTDYGNIEIEVSADELSDRERCALAEAAEKHKSLTRDPPQCPRCGGVLTRWKRGQHNQIKRAECDSCGWCR